jgi:hypothetical protein
LQNQKPAPKRRSTPRFSVATGRRPERPEHFPPAQAFDEWNRHGS